MSDIAPIRWGIIGSGGIARMFATDLRLLPDASLVAIGSRQADTAEEFGASLDVPHRHATYDDLVNDPDVDAVYVATPHPGHHDAALSAINAGKAVLVEKPFTMNAKEAASLIDAAQSRGVFLMEAMWARFLPHMVRARELLAEGALGDVRVVIADHNQWFARDASHRLFDPALGGGALLDLGIYPVSFASMVLGTPTRVTAVSEPAFTGVDATTSAILQYANGAQAVLTTSLEVAGPTSAVIVGTEARIEFDDTFYAPTPLRLIGRDGTVRERFEAIGEPRGMQHEAAEVMRCMRAGQLESEALPLAETLSIMGTLDEIRRQIGLVYAGE
jgi:predicted dehydrogenase